LGNDSDNSFFIYIHIFNICVLQGHIEIVKKKDRIQRGHDVPRQPLGALVIETFFFLRDAIETFVTGYVMEYLFILYNWLFTDFNLSANVDTG